MKTKILIALIAIATLTGCEKQPEASDPTERGLNRIGLAIVIAALIRGTLNK